MKLEYKGLKFVMACLNTLILVDIILITIALIFTLPENIDFTIRIFDFFVCIILLVEWFFELYISKPRSSYFKHVDTWLSLIASIPFDVLLAFIFPGTALLRYLRLFRILRIILMFNKFFNVIGKFLDKTNLHKILAGVVLTVAVFTTLLYYYGPSYGLFDDFYFVIVTLTTVGYGDVTPKTFNEKIISIVLIVIGVFIFSTIIAAISSFLTDRLVGKDEEEENNRIKELISENHENVMNELNIVREENKKLKDEITDLKELFKNK